MNKLEEIQLAEQDYLDDLKALEQATEQLEEACAWRSKRKFALQASEAHLKRLKDNQNN